MSTGTRRRWTTEEKIGMLREAQRFLGGIPAYARAQNMSQSQLYNWRRGHGLNPSGGRPTRKAPAPAPQARRTLEEKRQIVEAAGKSGNIIKWCMANGVPVASVYTWRHKLLAAGELHEQSRKQAATEPASQKWALKTPIEQRIEELEAHNALLRAMVAVANRNGLLGDLLDFEKVDFKKIKL